jgi:hypothetical protein
MNEHAKRNALNTGFAALLLLVYGWIMKGITVFPDLGPTYEITISIFNWMLKLGGIGLALAAIMCFAGLSIGLLMDFIVSAGCGLVMALCSIYWMITQKNADLQDILFLVFGVMFIRAAFGSLSLYKSDHEPDVVDQIAPADAHEPHPASIHPDVLPTEDQPPPPEGYLAALSKDPNTPPTASHE